MVALLRDDVTRPWRLSAQPQAGCCGCCGGGGGKQNDRRWEAEIPRGCAGAPAGTRATLSSSKCEKTKDKKKRRSSETDIPSYLCHEVETCYRLKMPEDFYHFWKFCEELDPDEPCDALQSTIGLQLVGPYDILAGKHKKTNQQRDVNFNLHWRFFYDPPEFQTILTGDSKMQYHVGYFRDMPDELPVWVGENEAKKGCMISQVGDNIFAAVKLFLSRKLKELPDKKKSDILKVIDEKLTDTAKKMGYSLEQKTVMMKQRDKKVVTKSFHGAGLVVPVDKNGVGYRELPETNVFPQDCWPVAAPCLQFAEEDPVCRNY
ncbi:histone PARylation factor 1 isoform X3 [Paroedura picta]|uniref:histone PARylation factor 1 isoform X3 n=1 Tax=Paroedura picta TaxID=143630 RepID=UPI0040572F42